MKRSILVFLAIMGLLTGTAHAQITIGGYIDGGIRKLTNVDSAGADKTTMGSNGTNCANRLRFSGIEDLGGDMKAQFILETGFNTGTGGLDNPNGTLFNRTATVGLTGSWGALEAGHQHTIAFWTMKPYDPFNYKYFGITYPIAASAGLRFDNDVKYTGKFGPLTLRAEYAPGEVAGASSTNSAAAVGASYAQGPMALGAAYTKKTPALPATGATVTASTLTGDYTNYTFGGAYTFGKTRLTLGYVNEKAPTLVGAAAAKTTNKYTWAGVNHAISPVIDFTGAWYHLQSNVAGSAAQIASGAAGEGRKNLLIVGLNYAFSKRTNFYLEADRTRLDGSKRISPAAVAPLAPQTSQTGTSIGINHAF